MNTELFTRRHTAGHPALFSTQTLYSRTAYHRHASNRNLATNAQRAAEKRMWDAAFTIQAAYRRMLLRRRRRARALKHAMGASNAAAAWNQGLEQVRERTQAAAVVAAVARGEKELDGGGGNNDVGGLATSGGGTRGGDERGQLGGATATSPPTNGGGDNATTTSGVGTTTFTTGDEGNRPAAGQGPASGVGEHAPLAAVPEYDDVGDIALAAVRLARNAPPKPSPPAVVVQERTQPMEAKPVRGPRPSQEETLEYYEAKMRYLAAQEKAHGASACKIQASKELKLCVCVCWLSIWCCIQGIFLGRASLSEDRRSSSTSVRGGSV